MKCLQGFSSLDLSNNHLQSSLETTSKPGIKKPEQVEVFSVRVEQAIKSPIANLRWFCN